jgi:hypothetical protein
LRDRLQHVSGLGDVRKIELGLDFIAVARQLCRRRCSAILRFRFGAEILPDLFGFVVLDFAGVALFIGNPQLRQLFNDYLRGHLQFPG